MSACTCRDLWRLF